MKQLLFSMGIAVFLLTGCSSKKTVTLPAYSAEISFDENTAAYYPGDQLMKCRLMDTALINGYHCMGWIWFFENGQVKQFKTARDIHANGYVIPAKSTIFFNEQYPAKIKYIWLAQDVNINNISCKGGGKISTEFYENDSLKACFLTKDQNIQGFPCKSSLMEPVYFYPDGKIQILTLSTNATFGDMLYKKGASIRVDENGTVSPFIR